MLRSHQWYCAVVLGLGSAACSDQEVIAPQAPAEALFSSHGAGGLVAVTPGHMAGWFFNNDSHSGFSTGALVAGAGTPPRGVGSAHMTLAASTSGMTIKNAAYRGTRLDALTRLEYSTYRASADAGNNLAIALQFAIDFNSTDGLNGFQGRLVFEPYHTSGGAVLQDQWQTWNALSGKWWASRPASSGGLCPQSSPCTWTQVLLNWPDASILDREDGAVIFKAGSGWSGFDGNVDAFTIGVGGEETTFDFDLDPTEKQQCDNDGWHSYGFKSRGQCIRFISSGQDSR